MYPTPLYGPSIVQPASLLLRAEDYVAGACSGEWSVDETRCNRSYTNRLKLEVATQYIGPAQVIALSGVRIGDTYRFPLWAGSTTETDTGSFAQAIRAERNSEQGPSGACQWIVTIDYGPFDVSYHLGLSDIASGQVNPTNQVSKIFWDSAKYKYSKPDDFSDPAKPYVNTAGDPFTDTPEFEETRPVLKFVRNQEQYDEGQANTFRDTVNGDAFLGCPPNSVKCRDIKGEQDYDPDWGTFWHVTYEFEFRVDVQGHGFTQRIANAGYRYKKNGTGDPINAVDSQGQQATDIILLQKNGDKLAGGSDPYYLEFAAYPTSYFALLNIPDSIFQGAP